MAIAICGEADLCMGDPAKCDFRQGTIQSDGHEHDWRIAWLALLLAQPSSSSLVVPRTWLGAPVALQNLVSSNSPLVPRRFENHFLFRRENFTFRMRLTGSPQISLCIAGHKKTPREWDPSIRGTNLRLDQPNPNLFLDIMIIISDLQ